MQTLMATSVTDQSEWRQVARHPQTKRSSLAKQARHLVPY